jgi:hypothetical protein
MARVEDILEKQEGAPVHYIKRTKLALISQAYFFLAYNSFPYSTGIRNLKT